MMSKVVLIAGGSGLVGSKMSALFAQAGYEVRCLTRRPAQQHDFAWNPSSGQIDDRALDNVNILVNLAGAGIADKRWTKKRKEEIIESRTESNRTLANALQRSGVKPDCFLSASAIGYYGNTGEVWVTETMPSADKSFMVECCRLWEKSAQEVAAFCGRTCVFRIGIVLAAEGGALAEIARPMKFGVGAWFGGGYAWYSWIHRDDLCRMFIAAAERSQYEGVYNAVAPNPVRNKVFVKAVRKALHSPALLAPAPEFALKLVLGEMSAVVLNSNRISGEKIVKAGFKFEFPELAAALAEVFH
ncbi:MAG: TIGR01777 family oxidoreductase [Saprospiraceae bacterium]|nr:TIGR01777 family oxidoreductase [Saprospiraceae bacterium]